MADDLELLAISSSWLLLGRRLSPHSWRHVLLDAGLLLRSNRALETIALLQARPIGCDIWPKILGKPDSIGEAERVSDHDVGGGEAASTQGLGICGGCLDGAQPAQEPF